MNMAAFEALLPHAVIAIQEGLLSKQEAAELLAEQTLILIEVEEKK